MSQPGTIERVSSQSSPDIQVLGDWTLAHFPALEREVHAKPLSDEQSRQTIDLSGLGQIDTAGASLLGRWMGPENLLQQAQNNPSLPKERAALLAMIANALNDCPPTPGAQGKSGGIELLEHIGISMTELWGRSRTFFAFIGMTLETSILGIFKPGTWRITSLTSHLEQVGLHAVPIIALLTFMVGAVVAFLGATVLADFGATIYSVHLVAYSFLREFGVLLTAILLAGRTASAFTAQIGSMKANEEIDAIRTLGLSPINMLVLPRVLAMLIALPILTFIAMICGIIGGAVVCTLMLDISPNMFFNIIHDEISAKHFFVGMSKAPVFAFLIAIIGCMEGFRAGGSAKSVGDHTTSAVVQSIFCVILLDAVAALFFMEMGW